MWFRCEVDPPLAIGAVPLNLRFRGGMSTSQLWPDLMGKRLSLVGDLLNWKNVRLGLLVAILATIYGVPRKTPTQRKADPRNGETEPR